MERAELYMKKVIIIGGGLGGLSCAISLAANGNQVTIVEKEATLGGKLKRIEEDGYTFDLGPSTITMLSAFEEVFQQAGRKIDDYLHFYRINNMTRHFFSDGHSLDLTDKTEEMEQQISEYSISDAKQYRAFLEHSQKLYRISEKRFLNTLLLRWQDRINLRLLKSFVQIKPFTSMTQSLSSFFSHGNSQALFGRYATYVGSAPNQAPQIFTMMAFLEGKLGIFGVTGGTYSIVSAFEKLAVELGVTIKKSCEVHKIHVESATVKGVETAEGLLETDLVVANGDALTIYQQLIDEAHRPSMTNRKLASYEPSLSGFVLLLGVSKQYSQLEHHNVFFPENYQEEFKDIFTKKQLPDNPAIYICYSGKSEESLAPTGHSNLFILINAPYLTEQYAFDQVKNDYADKIIQTLEKKGLSNLRQNIMYQKIITPGDLAAYSGAHRGAIYGMSSNTFTQAFSKIRNKSKDIKNLWFVGGSTHPGGGTPIVTKSGQLVAKEIMRE